MKTLWKRLISLGMCLVCFLTCFTTFTYAKSPKVTKDGYVINPTDYPNMYKSSLKKSDFDFIDENMQSVTVNEQGEVNTIYDPTYDYYHYLDDGDGIHSSQKGYSNFIDLFTDFSNNRYSYYFVQGNQSLILTDLYSIETYPTTKPVSLKLRNGIKLGSTEEEVINAYGNQNHYERYNWGRWKYEKHGPYKIDLNNYLEKEFQKYATSTPEEYFYYNYNEPKAKGMSWKDYSSSDYYTCTIYFYFDQNKTLCEIIAQ